MCVCARLMSSHLSGYPFPVSPALPSNEKKDAQLMRSNLRAERVLCRSNAPPPPHRVGCSLLACCCRGLTDSVLV